jgi:hypothetical protein
MPNHAGPNTKGEENLVFGYDLGDVKNSYKGEPTTNFVAEIADPTLEISRGEFGQYLNLVPIFETHGLVPYTLSMEIKGNRPGGCLVYMQNGSYTKYGFVGTSVNITTEWQRFSFRNLTPSGPTSAWQANTPNDNRAMLATYTTYGSGVNPTVRNIQIEYGSHETPFTASTRSATQGLIDLNGNSAIDLTNVSFDSNAQMTFDGTNDYASTSVLSMGTPSAITLECVIRFSGTLDSNDRKVMHYDKTGTTNAVFQLRKGTTNSQLMYQAHDGATWYTMTDTDAIESDTWVHIICTHSGTFGVMYKNGTQSATQTMGILDWTNANNILIGYRAAAEYWKGDIAMMKIYNRALTASEVASNYNAIKGRFNI